MFNFLKRKSSKIFEGHYWAKGWKLIPFKVGAVSEEEAEKILAKEKDFQMVCRIGVAK